MNNLATLLTDNNIELYPNFEGYRLSNKSPQVYEFPLKNAIIQALPNIDQYSYLHMRLFSYHNHLFIDSWTNPKGVYFIDNQNKVFKLNIVNIIDEGLKELIEIWEVPTHHERQNGHYNPSMVFLSEDLIAFSDGSGTLHLVETSNRNVSGSSWKCLLSIEPCESQCSFSLFNGIKSNSNQIHLLALRIAEKEKTDDASSFCSIIEWISIDKENSWNQSSRRQIEVFGPVYSAYLDQSGESLYIAAEGKITCLWDSNEKDEQEQNELENPKYFWWQTNDDIKIQLPISDDPLPTKKDITINVSSQDLTVKLKDRIILDGKLTNRIDTSLTTFTIENENLIIELSKNESDEIWPDLLPISSGRGEQLIEPTVANQIHEQLAHLTSEKPVRDSSGILVGGNDKLEECDEPPKDIFRLVRIVIAPKNPITHKFNLTGHQWIYGNYDLKNGNQNICLRHGVDGYIWAPEKLDDSLAWNCKQKMVFPALGYIHAGKPKRKFTVLSPDLNIACIAEQNGQLYIYYHPNASQNADQIDKTMESIHNVFNIREEIIGIYLDNKYVFVLTPCKIFTLILPN